MPAPTMGSIPTKRRHTIVIRATFFIKISSGVRHFGSGILDSANYQVDLVHVDWDVKVDFSVLHLSSAFRPESSEFLRKTVDWSVGFCDGDYYFPLPI